MPCHTGNWDGCQVFRVSDTMRITTCITLIHNSVPILESEVSPPEMRGKLLVSWQTFVAIGIFLGAAANCVFEGQWRHQFGIAFLPALPLLCLCFVIREFVFYVIL